MLATEARKLANEVIGNAPTLNCIRLLKEIKEVASRGYEALEVLEGIEEKEKVFFESLGYKVTHRVYAKFNSGRLFKKQYSYLKEEAKIAW